MTDLQEKWIQEAEDAILKIKNGIDVFAELKRNVPRDRNYEQAAKLRDQERAFNEKLLSLFEVSIRK